MSLVLKQMPASTLADLQAMLQRAIELEHSTIPPYLTANFTLYSQTSTTNSQISEIVGSVLSEEMLHMTVACNVLNAIGGNPVINSPTFIPDYPGHLPGGVEGSLIVGLEPFSLSLVQNIFMEIERPENQAPVQGADSVPDDGVTIGTFYQQIADLMTALEKEQKKNGSTIFTGSPASQVIYPEFYPDNVLFPITDLTSALKGIGVIVDQGEGTSTDPVVSSQDSEGQTEPAHFYRFEGIVQGKELVVNTSTTPPTYSYTGAAIAFDPAQVIKMWPNPSMSQYPPSSLAYENNKLFNYNYTCLLNSLHETFNGNPDKIKNALGLMFSLRLYALKLLALPHPQYPSYQAGPSFEYQPSL